MWELEYCSCDAGPDLWMKAQYRPKDMLEYMLENYSFILCYVDDILCIHHDQDDELNKLNVYMPLKPMSFWTPNMYLGTKLKCMDYIMALGLGL